MSQYFLGVVKNIFLIVAVFIFSFTPMFAQENKEIEPPVAIAKYTTEKFNIDGIANEKAWNEAEFVSNFWQYFPSDDKLAEQQTKMKFLFSEDYLYVLIVAEGKNDKFVVSSLRRDFSARDSDNVTLLLDTFNDATNAFMFGSNPLGVKREAQISNGGQNFPQDFNLSWDIKWEAEASIGEKEYTVEFKIPLTSIKYSNPTKEIRANLYRFDTQIGERSTWAFVPQNQRIASPAFMGKIIFEKPLPKSKGLINLLPFISGITQRDIENSTNLSNFSFGGDANIAVGDGLNLDLTVNPDFSQVEVDDQVINLTRFEVNLPEKRQFFIRNSDVFTNFGNSRDAQPFFSRRIGVAINPLTDEVVQNRIIAGARISGKLNDDWRLGFLNMQTATDEQNNIAANNNTVFTLQKKVFSRSNVNFIFINRQNTNNPEFETGYAPYNRVVGFDYNLASKDNKWNGRFYYHHSFTPDENLNPFSTGLNVEYQSTNHSFVYDGIRVGEDFVSDLGFIRRTGVFRNFLRYRYQYWVNSKTITSISTAIALYNAFEPENNNLVTDRGFFTSTSINFRNQSRFSFNYENQYTYLTETFDPTRTDDVVPLPDNKGFHYGYFEFRYNSDLRKNVYVNLNGRAGNFFNGSLTSLRTDVNIRLQPYFIASLNATVNIIKLPLPYNSSTLVLAGPRFDVTFSKQIFWNTFVQLNTQTNELGINSRLQWRVAPLSDLFIVYNDLYDTEFSLLPRFKSLTFKFTYNFNI